MSAAHRFPIRVYYEDTDLAGIVYYANYLKFIERGRTEMLRALGVSQSDLLRDAGIVFVVRRCVVDYLAPARFDDALEVETEVASVGAASLALLQTVTRDGAALVRAEVRLACVGRDGRPTRAPKAVRSLLSAAALREAAR